MIIYGYNVSDTTHVYKCSIQQFEDGSCLLFDDHNILKSTGSRLEFTPLGLVYFGYEPCETIQLSEDSIAVSQIEEDCKEFIRCLLEHSVLSVTDALSDTDSVSYALISPLPTFTFVYNEEYGMCIKKGCVKYKLASYRTADCKDHYFTSGANKSGSNTKQLDMLKSIL